MPGRPGDPGRVVAGRPRALHRVTDDGPVRASCRAPLLDAVAADRTRSALHGRLVHRARPGRTVR